MKKPEYKIVKINRDIISTSCTEVQEICSVVTCNLECTPYNHTVCVGQGVDDCSHVGCTTVY